MARTRCKLYDVSTEIKKRVFCIETEMLEEAIEAEKAQHSTWALAIQVIL